METENANKLEEITAAYRDIIFDQIPSLEKITDSLTNHKHMELIGEDGHVYVVQILSRGAKEEASDGYEFKATCVEIKYLGYICLKRDVKSFFIEKKVSGWFIPSHVGFMKFDEDQ